MAGGKIEKKDRLVITIIIEKDEIEQIIEKAVKDMASDEVRYTIENTVKKQVKEEVEKVSGNIHKAAQEIRKDTQKKIENLEQVLDEFLAMKISRVKAKGENTTELNYLKQKIL